MLHIKKKKHYYLLKFIFIFLNYKYLCFLKDKHIKILISDFGINKVSKIDSIKVKSTLIRKIFSKNHFFNFLKNDFFLIYFNDFEDYMKLLKLNNDILALSSSMFLINNDYIKNIYNYYLYYKENYLLYKKIIFLFFEKYYFFIFFILRNILIILKLILKKKIN